MINHFNFSLNLLDRLYNPTIKKWQAYNPSFFLYIFIYLFLFVFVFYIFYWFCLFFYLKITLGWFFKWDRWLCKWDRWEPVSTCFCLPYWVVLGRHGNVFLTYPEKFRIVTVDSSEMSVGRLHVGRDIRPILVSCCSSCACACLLLVVRARHLSRSSAGLCDWFIIRFSFQFFGYVIHINKLK